jgi:F-type H+-transporting ATPase subunit epsilon
MSKTIQVDIVSTEARIFSGVAERVVATGALGELGIYPGHTQLITSLLPGVVRVITAENHEEVFYVNGGVLEVQPHLVSILADTAARADNIDEAAALEAKARAEQIMQDRTSEVDYTKAAAELAHAVAQLQAIQKLKKRLKA